MQKILRNTRREEGVGPHHLGISKSLLQLQLTENASFLSKRIQSGNQGRLKIAVHQEEERMQIIEDLLAP